MESALRTVAFFSVRCRTGPSRFQPVGHICIIGKFLWLDNVLHEMKWIKREDGAHFREVFWKIQKLWFIQLKIVPVRECFHRWIMGENMWAPLYLNSSKNDSVDARDFTGKPWERDFGLRIAFVVLMVVFSFAGLIGNSLVSTVYHAFFYRRRWRKKSVQPSTTLYCRELQEYWELCTHGVSW